MTEDYAYPTPSRAFKVFAALTSPHSGEGTAMHGNSQFSRRDIARLCGLGFIGAGLFPALVRRASAASPVLTVGHVAVRRVDITPRPLTLTPPSIKITGTPAGDFCRLQSGGIQFRAEVELEAIAGLQPHWFGQLTVLQNVHFKHRRTSASTGKSTCATSASKDWDIDGQYPYLRNVVPSQAGPNRIDHGDAPGVFTEDPSTPYESVEVQPVDLFRTYVIWETTNNNRAPSRKNTLKRHFQARIDWSWQGVALPPSPTLQSECSSIKYAPTQWALTQAAPLPGTNAKVFIGPAALTAPTPPLGHAPPRFKPTAQPNAWAPC